jgi:hypothetical protein
VVSLSLLLNRPIETSRSVCVIDLRQRSGCEPSPAALPKFRQVFSPVLRKHRMKQKERKRERPSHPPPSNPHRDDRKRQKECRGAPKYLSLCLLLSWWLGGGLSLSLFPFIVGLLLTPRCTARNELNFDTHPRTPKP